MREVRKAQQSPPPRNLVASISCYCGGFGMTAWFALWTLIFFRRSHWSYANPASNLEFFILIALGLSGPALGLVGAVLGLVGIGLARSSSEGVGLGQAWTGLLLGLLAVTAPLLVFCLLFYLPK